MKRNIGFLLMRLGLGIVFLIFGFGKFQGDVWAQTMQNMGVVETMPWEPNISVMLVGIIEIVTAAGLILGLFIRFFGGAAAVELLIILILLRFQPVRDIGLLGASVYIMVDGTPFGGLDQIRKRKGV